MTDALSIHRIRALFRPAAVASDPGFAEYLSGLTRPIVRVAAWLTLLMLPALMLLELRLVEADATWWLRLWIRLPILLFALAVLLLGSLRPGGDWPRQAALGLALLLVCTGWVMFVVHAATAEASLVGASHVMTMLIPAVAVLAAGGARESVTIYLLPLLLTLVALWLRDLRPHDVIGHFAYPILAMPIGIVISEILYRGHIRAYVARRQLEQSAMTDPLTGLLNRRALDRLLRAEHARYLRHGQPYAVVMADLDRFKQVNDRHGHDVGDQVLSELSARMQSAVRAEDQLGRWGGEEFLVLLQATDGEAAAAVAEKIRVAVADAPFATDAGPVAVTISLGVTASRDDARFDDVVIRADQALYRAKNDGRNRAVVL